MPLLHPLKNFNFFDNSNVRNFTRLMLNSNYPISISNRSKEGAYPDCTLVFQSTQFKERKEKKKEKKNFYHINKM